MAVSIVVPAVTVPVLIVVETGSLLVMVAATGDFLDIVSYTGFSVGESVTRFLVGKSDSGMLVISATATISSIFCIGFTGADKRLSTEKELDNCLGDEIAPSIAFQTR